MDKELLQRLWRDAVRALRMQLAPEDIDAYILEESKGAVKSMADLKAKLVGEDIRQPKALGALRSVAQGGTLGFQDELAGLFDAATGGDYKATRDAERQLQHQFAGENPKTDLALQLAGGIALPGMGASQAVRGGLKTGSGLLPILEPGIAQLAGRGAAVGAASGLLGGVGYSEGETPDAIAADATRAAGTGAAMGGVVGAATKPIAGMVGGSAQYLRDLFDPKAFEARGNAQAAKVMDIPRARAAMAEMEAVRPGQGMLADATPRAAKLLDNAAARSPELAETVNEQLNRRNAGMGPRLAADLTDQAGVPLLNVVETKAAAKAAVRPTAEKLYTPLEKMYPAIVPNETSTKLFEELSDPKIEQVYRAIAPAEGQAPSFKALQSTLKRLRDNTTEAYGKGRGNEAEEWKDLAARLEVGMEDAMPGFKAANAGYARTLTTVRAFDEGAEVMGMDSREIPALLARTRKAGGEEAVTALRMGGIDRLAQQLRSITEGKNPSEALIQRAQEFEDKLQQLFPNKRAFDAFMRRVEVERMMNRTRTAVQGNSRTFERAATDAALNPEPVMGGKAGMAQAAMAGADKALRGNLGEQASTYVGTKMRLGAGKELDDFLATLDRIQRLSGKRSSALTGIGSGLLPSLGGQLAPRFGD